MKLMCECVLIKDTDGWTAILPQLNDAASSGKTREEALRAAREIMEMEAGDILREGGAAPRMRHLAEVMALEVDVTAEDAERMEYVTKAKAAEWLEVSRPRITALVGSGRLAVKRFGRDELVSIESIDAYRKGERRPGRPQTASSRKPLGKTSTCSDV